MKAAKPDKKKSKTIKQEPVKLRQVGDLEFRTPRELLVDYVTGRAAHIIRPQIVVKHDCDCDAMRQWAFVADDDGSPEGTDWVCSIARLNFWMLSKIAAWQTAEIEGLLELVDDFTTFLCVSADHTDIEGVPLRAIADRYDEPVPSELAAY